MTTRSNPIPFFAAVFALLVSTAVLALPASAQLGVAAGLNFESVDDIETNNANATFDNATGYHVGVFYDLGVGPAGLRLGLFYRDIGEVDVSFGGIRDAFSATMIDIPVDVRFNLTTTPVIRPYIMAGPVFSWASTDDSDYEDALNDVSVAGNVGVGLALDLGGLTLTPEFRYAVGISRFMKEEVNIRGVSFSSGDVQRLNTVMLRVGVTF
jgi:hypothetical protein